MKGSPILATLLACLIMLAMYAGMRVAFSIDGNTTQPETSTPVEHIKADQVSVYLEIYFSSEAKNFSLTHPATALPLIKVNNLNASEWSGDVFIPVKKLTSDEIEIQCEAQWESPQDGYKFMQVIISPDDLDSQTQTIRAEGDITDIMKFHWKENE
ncbi:MAG: hypothetical protein ACSHX6_04420 [Akkermansiaceae bacterium]